MFYFSFFVHWIILHRHLSPRIFSSLLDSDRINKYQFYFNKIRLNQILNSITKYTDKCQHVRDKRRPIREPPRIPFLDYFSPRMRRNNTNKRQRDWTKKEFFRVRRGKGRGEKDTFLHRTGVFLLVRDGGDTSQSAWPAQSFRQTREGETDIPKQTEHSAERACRRNLFVRTKGIALSLASVFGALPSSLETLCRVSSSCVFRFRENSLT